MYTKFASYCSLLSGSEDYSESKTSYQQTGLIFALPAAEKNTQCEQQCGSNSVCEIDSMSQDYACVCIDGYDDNTVKEALVAIEKMRYRKTFK